MSSPLEGGLGTPEGLTIKEEGSGKLIMLLMTMIGRLCWSSLGTGGWSSPRIENQGPRMLLMLIDDDWGVVLVESRHRELNLPKDRGSRIMDAYDVACDEDWGVEEAEC